MKGGQPMSLKNVNLAVMIRRAQRKDSQALIYCRNMFDELSKSLEENGLSSYFIIPLSEDEKFFMKTFFKVLNDSLGTLENIVPIYFQRFLNIDVERAKQLTNTFGIHLVEGGSSNLLYLSWSKGILDEE